MKIRVFTAFSGYDSQCLALDALKAQYPDFDYELVGWSEIDKYAIQAHNALYPQWADRNYGDISKIDWSQVPDFDLFTYSSPCQDFSQAGKQAGGEKGSGTRSSLLWECQRAIEAKRPAVTLMENVAALVGSKFIKTFNEWQLTLSRLGYTNHAKVLDAKDFGVPQHRERIFLVGMLDDRNYYFPQPFKLEKRLKDVLEQNVDEKYYLSDETIKAFTQHCDRKQAEGCGFSFEPTDGGGEHPTSSKRLLRQIPRNTDADGCARCLKADYYKMGVANFMKHEGDGFVATCIIEIWQGVANTLTSVQKVRIRKLTPKECFRLMGVEDKDIDTLLNASISNSQLYKLAGNSIVKDVLYHIFRKIYVEQQPDNGVQTLF